MTKVDIISGFLGAGKTTLADVILGVLKPEAGQIQVDGINVFERDMSEVLSKNYIEICRRACKGKSDAEQCYNRLLLATDCVCSMTDRFAREFFLELQGLKISQNY